MLTTVEIVAIAIFLGVLIVSLIIRWWISRRLEDIDGISDVFDYADEEGDPVGKL